MVLGNDKQLILDIQLDNDARFSNFATLPNSSNAYIVTLLQGLAEPTADSSRFIYLYGNSGSGRTHLLQALCNLYREQQREVRLVPLKQLIQQDAEVALPKLDGVDLICIDDIQLIGQPELTKSTRHWELMLMRLFNHFQNTQLRLCISASRAPDKLAGLLPDLVSRLQSGLSLALQDNTDELQAFILEKRAAIRGLHFSKRQIQYLLNRSERNMQTLMQHLKQFDTEAMRFQSDLSLNLIRKELN